MSSTLSRLKREGGIPLETLLRKGASSRIEGRISWAFSSRGRKLGVPLELRQGPQGTTDIRALAGALAVWVKVRLARSAKPRWGGQGLKSKLRLDQ